MRLLLLCAVWLTTNVTIGYIVAPVLFKVLDKMQAGQVMSILLNGLYFFDLAIILLMIFGLMLTQKCHIKRESWLIASAILVGMNQWFISPKMEWLKLHDMKGQVMQLSFMEWHGVSQVVFLLMLLSFAFWSYKLFRRIQQPD
ncbi:DUF4149 domain-containing protein [Hydrogenovibrio sp. JE_KL2]|uniref:DUF4149 domain-containing protein n=1 Tax=Hydrogenovibrio sp. JE_KL2 TaxID=2651188 RepID=UPI00128E94B4|nr:DUF4149 domain-containing protein [Hydrogenovibrio sp. JE_KL2]MPQ77173.1 DUF4149 domain-containing protein [Hydrogenovibrio sp. JE_KL2]